MCGPQRLTDGGVGGWGFSPCPLLFSSSDIHIQFGALLPPSHFSCPCLTCPQALVVQSLTRCSFAHPKWKKRRRRVGGDYLQSVLVTCIPYLSVTSEGVLHLSCNYLHKYVENCEAAHISLIIWSCRQAGGRPTVALMT